MTDIDAEIDTASKAAKLVGDLAQAAMTVGPVIIAVAELILPWIPGLGPIVADIQVALPILQKIAQYAPAVQTGLQQGKPLIQATVDIGNVLLMPLAELLAAFPKLAIVNEFFGGLDAFLKQNAFQPNDPRFNRDDPSQY